MITIDGKDYPLWSQFVEGKDKWIGGVLEEFSDRFSDGGSTEITDITLDKTHGSVCFTIHGKTFDECFTVAYGGVTGGDHDWINFSAGAGGFVTNFRIKPK